MTKQNNRLEEKKQRLFDNLKQLDSLAVAFSGGVDSSLLLAAAHQVLGDSVVAMTAKSVTHPAREAELATDIVQQLGVRHYWFDTHELSDPEFLANDSQRCYYCKKIIFRTLCKEARKMGIERVAHGANRDDMSDFRPGRMAAEEAGIISPLNDADLNKAEIRELARQMGLPNWDRPAMACLATRIPYGTAISLDTLALIDAAEAVLWKLDVPFCRVRHHGDLARIEIRLEDMSKFTTAGFRENVAGQLRALGYRYVCLDLEGYESGKMNRGIGGSSNS